MTSFAVAGARIFDGEAMIGEQAVVVDAGRIVSIGDVPEGADVMDARGCMLLPGFIDAHVHLGFFDPRAVARAGVTTVRDLGWPLDALSSLHGGPAVIFAGPIVTARGGYPSRAAWAPPGTALEVDDEATARAAVRTVAARGACIVKIAQEPRAGAVLAPSIVKAIVEEARAYGLRVTSHCGSLEQLLVALDAGVAELAHGLWSDEQIPGDILTRMVHQGVTVIPTLHVDPSPQRVAAAGSFVAAGGRVVYGTDMGNPPVPAGIDAKEIGLMREAGMEPSAALHAATRGAADHLGMADRGRIAVGARADLVLVRGNPMEDPAALARVESVWMGGEQLS